MTKELITRLRDFVDPLKHEAADTIESLQARADNLKQQAKNWALEAQVAALRSALTGFIANSCRVDWPADIYDAAIAAQKGTP